MTKKCSQCSQTKPIEEFIRNSRTKDGRKSYCKSCSRGYDLRRRYNIDLNVVEKLFTEQNGKCAICKNNFPNKKAMHMDHNHETGEIRQLLCRDCNALIGLAKEDITILTSAIEYLKQWS